MLIDFFLHLKERRLPVSTTEYLSLLEALAAGLASCEALDHLGDQDVNRLQDLHRELGT